MLKQIFKNKFNILLTLTILFAAFLRLYRIQDYMTFLGDEGRDALVAYNILHGHFTLLGPTASVGGFYFGPIYYYFMAPFLLLFNYNPVGPAVMVALFGIATVYLVYRIGSIFFNRVIGLLAVFLYAISPIIIAYSRSSWNPNPVPFFSLLVVWFVYKGVSKSFTAKWDFLWTGIFLGIAIELHFIVAILGAVVVLYMFVVRSLLYQGDSFKMRYGLLAKQYLFLGIGFFIGWLPYLGFEVRHGFPNTRNVFAFVFHSGKVSGENTNFFMIIGNVFFRLFARIVAAFPPPEQLALYPKLVINVWFIGILLMAIGSVVLVLWQFLRKSSKEGMNKTGLLFIILWLVIGVLLFGVYKRQIYEYYFGFMFAVSFLLVANLIVFLWQRKTIFKLLGSLMLLMLLMPNFQGIPFRFEPNRQLQQTQTIAKFVNDKTNGQPFNFALITGGNSDHAYRYFFTIWRHEPVTIQNAAIDPKRKTVTDQLLVVCESIPCHPIGSPLWEIAGFGRAEVAGHWTVSVVEVYKLVHYKGK